MEPTLTDNYVINSVFPIPLYQAHRDPSTAPIEKKEIENIIESGLRRNISNQTTYNSYIFNTKLKNLKEFCEKHVNLYVRDIVKPRQKYDWYFTQSWLNVTEPGEFHHVHNHPNSIISGVFYVKTLENDSIEFVNPSKHYQTLRVEPKEYNLWNSLSWNLPIEDNQLVIFPSWLQHNVPQNRTSESRISFAFNVFVKGIFGKEDQMNELVLEEKYKGNDFTNPLE